MTTPPPTAPSPLQRALEKAQRDLGEFFLDAFTALNVNGISGDYVEFGSAGATTMRAAHDVVGHTSVPRHLWAFDSFQGLPEAADPRDHHPGWYSGGAGQGGVEAFRAMCDDHGVPRSAYTTVVGYYDETLPALGDGGPTDVALAYLDCNMYSSTVAALDFLSPRLKQGMVLAFDDYWCWSAGDVSGERSAFLEFAAAHPQWHFERFKDVHRAGVSFVVERADLLAPR